MKFNSKVFMLLGLITILGLCVPSGANAASIYDAWTKGPSKDPSYFMIGVWYQDSVYAPQYKALGINTYVVLGDSPSGMATLKANGMTAVLSADDSASWTLLSDPAFTCWLLPDEPDNAQFTGLTITINGTKYSGFPAPGRIPPASIKSMYDQVKAADTTRPVHLGMSQGIADSNWVGRGTMSDPGGWPVAYTTYNTGCDITGFDIYPYVSKGIDYLRFQALGLDNLKTIYGAGTKPIWNCFECTRVGSLTASFPTAQAMRSEVFTSLIHGSMGIIWFVHEVAPRPFDSIALLHNPTQSAAVKVINQQVAALAPVLNTPSSVGKATATSSTTVSIDIMVKEYNNYIYILSAGMRNGAAVGTFRVNGLTGDSTAEVLGESRSVPVTNGRFIDSFLAWDVHIYKISSGTGVASTNPLDRVRNFPNPISLTSGNRKARFDSIAVTDAKINIYNSGGTLLKVLTDKDYLNPSTAEWDLKDTNGETVSAGIYYFVVEDSAGNKKKGKIALVK